MIKIKPIEDYDLWENFGPPGDESMMVKKPFPFVLFENGIKSSPCYNFYGHKYIADAVIDAYKEILEIYGYEFIRNHGLDEYGGCFNYRKSRGSDNWSVHSWGLAVDILPSLGKYKEPSMIPYHFVDAFLNRGFVWGGFWDKPDGMHFSAVRE